MNTKKIWKSGSFSAIKAVFVSLPISLLLVMGLIPILGLLLGYTISRQNILLFVLLAAAVPVGILMLRRPFDTIILWLLVAPFFTVTSDTLTRAAYWVTQRAWIPVATIAMLVTCLTRRRLRVGWVEIFMLAYLLINVFSVLYYYSDDPAAMLQLVYETLVVGACLFWLIRTARPRQEQWEALMKAFLFMCLVQAIVGLMMNFPGTRSLLPPTWFAYETERTTGTLGRDGEFGGTLATCMLLVTHYAFHTRNRLTRSLCVLALFVGCLCLVFSFSRGTWLAAVIVVMLLLVLYRRVIPYALGVGVILLILLSTGIFDRSLAFAAERLYYERTVNSRIIANYAAIGMIEAKPLLGWGYENFDRYHMEFARPVGDTPLTDVITPSHNTYLSIGSELGLIGLGIYLMPYVLLLVQSLKAYKQLPRDGLYSRYLLLVLWLGVLFWFVINNFVNLLTAPWGMTFVQLLLGFIASVLDARQELEPKVISPASSYPVMA